MKVCHFIKLRLIINVKEKWNRLEFQFFHSNTEHRWILCALCVQFSHQWIKLFLDSPSEISSFQDSVSVEIDEDNLVYLFVCPFNSLLNLFLLLTQSRIITLFVVLYFNWSIIQEATKRNQKKILHFSNGYLLIYCLHLIMI